jgi:two-component system sensor histidine kinase LytS
MRYNDRVQVYIDIPTQLLSLQVLPGCLLTLKENAIKHAFIGLKPPYKISIFAEETEYELILKVRDFGIGIAPDLQAKLGKESVLSTNEGGGVGLHLLAQSLKLVFGDSAQLKFEGFSNGTTAIIIYPKRSI